ncbi:MAG: hypothetical protein ACYC59_03205 [Anaerolineaceae bacterium]
MTPYISGLRADIWQKSTREDRLQALGQLENYLAKQDGRQPSVISSETLSPYTRGLHQTDENGVDKIKLNSDLINRDTPYQAVETCFHEDRHSHQAGVVNHPEKAESQQQLKDWSMSFKDGYIQPNDYDHSAYRWQPTEADANKMARSNTDELYQNTFHDDQQYPQYKEGKEQEIADSIVDAKDKLGENYEDTTRQLMVNKYQLMHPEYQQNESMDVTKNQTEQNIGETRLQGSPLPAKIEKPEEKTLVLGSTPEDRAGIETLTTKEPVSIEGKEMINQPQPDVSREGNSPSNSNGGKEDESSEAKRYERGFYR